LKSAEIMPFEPMRFASNRSPATGAQRWCAEACHLIMINPQMGELSVDGSIPDLPARVGTDYKKAIIRAEMGFA